MAQIIDALSSQDGPVSEFKIFDGTTLVSTVAATYVSDYYYHGTVPGTLPAGHYSFGLYRVSNDRLRAAGEFHWDGTDVVDPYDTLVAQTASLTTAIATAETNLTAYVDTLEAGQVTISDFVDTLEGGQAALTLLINNLETLVNALPTTGQISDAVLDAVIEDMPVPFGPITLRQSIRLMNAFSYGDTTVVGNTITFQSLSGLIERFNVQVAADCSGQRDATITNVSNVVI